ncbi:RNA polymerase subunit sigma-24 [Thioalkalivibrio denitrificans]|uniref:RNA polymerase subunit sigma-24 n=1 Tax=Thioalkalivibrio denitrificans TaxID=108003 RepID=A0A1V3NRT0_9GAMM|nr:sigma-70 family RNA polymerase sigma factor [Thioalkalivibrio denitrificans]OOG27829.1 RNA polymerase subunit sigma-24 [Thioalkalivibrio denitrificans]
MPDPGSGGQGTDDRQQRRALFEQEVVRLMDRLYGTALRLTGNPDDAEDVVAEAVSKAWSKLDDLRDLESMEGWLFRILNNSFVSLWRRRKTRDEVEREAVETSDAGGFSLFQQLHQPFLLWWGTPEQEFLNDVLQEDLQKALDALPDGFRVVIVLVEVQGYTYEEVSALLEIPVGTVRSRLSRGRALLQKALWHQASEAGLVHGRRPSDGGAGEST